MTDQVNRLKELNGELCAEINRQEKRIRELESLVRDMLMAIDCYNCPMDAPHMEGMCELCHAENGGKSPCARTAEDLSESHCIPYTIEYFKERIAALGMEVDG